MAGTKCVANFEWLVRVLFGNGELVRIAELAEEY